MSEYNFEIRKGHEAEDIAGATFDMLNDVYPGPERGHAWEWVANEIFTNARDSTKIRVVQNYLNGLKISGWTGDIAKIFGPYLDIAITDILRKGADRLGVNTPDNSDFENAKAIIRKFQGETNFSYNHLLFYFMEGATGFMLRYLLDTGLQRLAEENPDAVVSVVVPYIPLAVSARLKGEDNGQESNQDCMASR